MTHRDFHPQEKRARDADTSGRTTNGGRSVAPPNIPDRAEALEAADNGRLQELAMWNAILGFAPSAEPAPLDPEMARLISVDLREMREQLIDAMKMLDANRDQAGAGELHARAGSLVNEIDEMAAVLRRETADQWGAK